MYVCIIELSSVPAYNNCYHIDQMLLNQIHIITNQNILNVYMHR